MYILNVKNADTTPFAIQAEHTNRINFFGTLNLCKALFPLLRPHARVVNVSSRAGLLKNIQDESIRNRLKSDDLTLTELIQIVENFIKYFFFRMRERKKKKSIDFLLSSY